MDEKTNLANVLTATNEKIRYDRQVKIVLSDKHILATILKHTTSEFAQYDIETIKGCIEGEPDIGVAPVFPGLSNADVIVGDSTEDSIPGEGTVTYDIKFYAITPEKNIVKIIINIEAQNDYYPGYDIVTRGIFYGARMLSSQLEKEFTFKKDDKKKYDNLKKVYSIWICMNCPKGIQNTITSYDINQHKLYGDFRGKARYDLMSVIMVCLSDKIEDNLPELIRMLSILLSSDMNYREKISLLEEMDVPMTRKFREEADNMCNLSEGVERKGITLGQIEEIISMGKDFNLDEDQIISRLINKCNLSEEEAKLKLSEYQQNN